MIILSLIFSTLMVFTVVKTQESKDCLASCLDIFHNLTINCEVGIAPSYISNRFNPPENTKEPRPLDSEWNRTQPELDTTELDKPFKPDMKPYEHTSESTEPDTQSPRNVPKSSKPPVQLPEHRGDIPAEIKSKSIPDHLEPPKHSQPPKSIPKPHRPPVQPPQHRANIPTDSKSRSLSFPTKTNKISFYLQVVNGSYKLDVDDLDTVDNAPLDPTQNLFVLIHGIFNDKEAHNMSKEIVPQLLVAGYKNIIVMDFMPLIRNLDLTIRTTTALNKNHGYYQVVKENPLIAENLANLLVYLVKMSKTSYSKIHLIGYGMGSHIAGYISKFIPAHEKIKRITALDPSLQGYSTSTDDKGVKALSSKDADFVDVYHTSKIFGSSDNIGHVDFKSKLFSFYGCLSADILVAGECKHFISVKLFAKSIERKINGECCSNGWFVSNCRQYITIGFQIDEHEHFEGKCYIPGEI